MVATSAAVREVLPGTPADAANDRRRLQYFLLMELFSPWMII
jgi:hypothetical protein